MNQDRSIYDNLADQFDQLWNSGERPDLQEFLDQVDMTDRPVLAEMLLTIEFEYRRATGESVLESDYQQGSIISQVAARLLSEDKQRQKSETLSQPPEFDITRSLPDGEHQKSRVIDRYKLLQKLGEGGMGAVWMAQQEHPVRRRVALKLIKGGADNREVIARFEAERQALAMMDHPNIAKVLDAGTTEEGLPYFVMELVQGIAINEYCDRNKLSPKERLELFVPACQAVQHAHQKGIIHRDLKPSNVLVAVYDGKPIAKVIDFGLAKALQHHTWLTDKTMFTQFGQVVGTPQYMSPEQATMDEISVDTRSDVYSLGVMLYELLAGSTPIDKEMLREHALLKVLEMIREQEPPRPSLRVSTAGEQIKTIGEHRKIQPVKLEQILRGDLDWIVMKAIEKDCSRRYETASGFADDIQRYLRGDAIEARPPSTAYRVSKFLSKHRRLAATAVAVLLLLTAGVIGTSVGLIRAQAARKLADRKTEVAKQKTEELAVEKERADLEKTRAQKSAKEARTAEAIAVNAQNETESTLARSNYLLANARWEQQRVNEALQALHRVPPKHRKFEWYLSQQEFLGSDVTNYDHTDAVSTVAFSPDGTRLITVSRDGAFKVTDLASGDLVKMIEFQASTLALSPDGKLLATYAYQKPLNIIEVESGKLLDTFKNDKSNYRTLAFSPDSSLIATANTDGEILLRECSTGKVLKTFVAPKQTDCLAFFPDGTRLVGGGTTAIKIWDTQSGDELENFDKSGSTYTDVAFSPDGKKFASRSYGKITIRDSEDYKVLRTIMIGQEVLEEVVHSDSVTFSPDGTFVAGNLGGKILIWDATTGNHEQTLVGHSAGALGSVRSLVFSPDGTKLVSGSGNGNVKIWSAVKGDGNTLLYDNRGAKPALSGDGSCIFCNRGSEIVIYDAGDGREIDSFANDSRLVTQPTFSPDGTRVAAACGDNGIRIWDYKKRCELAILTGHTGEVYDVAYSPDGSKLASSSADSTLKIWNALDGSELHSIKFPADTQRLNSVAFSPDGVTLAVGGWNGTITILDVASGKEVRTLKMTTGVHPDLVFCVAFSPDGSQLAAGGQRITSTGDIQTWNIRNGTLRNHFLGHTGGVSSIAFSPDGTRLASGSPDKTVKLWDVDNGNELKTITGHRHGVTSVEFSPDGTKLFSADTFETKLWNAGNPYKVFAHSFDICYAGLNDDSTRVFALDISNRLVTWDAATGKQLPIVSDLNLVDSISRKFLVTGKTRVSSNKRWTVAKVGTNVLLVDNEFRNSSVEKSNRKFKTGLNLHLHAKLAEEAEARQDWFAASFHRAWEMKADMYQNSFKLKLAVEKLDASVSQDANASQAESGRSMQLPPIVTEMLKRTRPPLRPISASAAKPARNRIWESVKSPLKDTKDNMFDFNLKFLSKASERHPRGATLATLGAAKFRLENYESAIADAMQSLERSRLRFKPAKYHACSLAVLAMSHHKLGNQAEANAFRKQLNDIMKNDDFKNDQDSIQFLKEVNNLFDAKPASEDNSTPKEE